MGSSVVPSSAPDVDSYDAYAADAAYDSWDGYGDDSWTGYGIYGADYYGDGGYDSGFGDTWGYYGYEGYAAYEGEEGAGESEDPADHVPDEVTLSLLLFVLQPPHLLFVVFHWTY